jgi:hypothetical protein
VPANGQLTFWHTYAFEANYDGAVLEISTDGGATFEDLHHGIVKATQPSDIVGGVASGCPRVFNVMNHILPTPVRETIQIINEW